MIWAALALLAVLTLAGCGPDISAPENNPVESPATAQTEQPAPTEPAATQPADTTQPETSPAGDASQEPATAAEAGFDAGNALPDFSVPLAGGGTFTLSEHLGKPVFINLFATWCPPCVGEMPEINQLHGELGDQVSFIVIDIGEDEATAQGFADNNGYSLPFAYSLDGMPFGGDYLINSIPRTFVLDSDGVISAYYEGSRDYDTFKAAIEAALAH
jgi:thiol-disulfide isomerase/thioredoxin